MNPYEIAITRCKELEQLLEQLGARGRGLFEKAVSVRRLLPPELFRKLKSIARTRNRLVHEPGRRWLLGQLETYIRACDWARDEIIKIAPGKFAALAERPAPIPYTPPPLERPAPAKSAPPPARRPAPVEFVVTSAVPAMKPAFSPPASIPDVPPVQQAARGVAYADALSPAPVRRFRPKRRIPVVLPLVLLFVAGAASSGRLPQIADAVRDLVDRGIQQAIELGNAEVQPSPPAASSEDRLPEIVPGPY
jgi:hypothetical protein